MRIIGSSSIMSFIIVAGAICWYGQPKAEGTPITPVDGSFLVGMGALIVGIILVGLAIWAILRNTRSMPPLPPTEPPKRQSYWSNRR